MGWGLSINKQYYPSSNQFRDPPTYTHQPSMQQKVPFSLISCSSSKVAFCSCVEWGWHIYNIVESESDPLTRRAVDLFEKEPLKGNSEVHLHTPTKFGEDRSKDLGGDREQTDRQTNRQTDKRCSIYSMMKKHLGWFERVTYMNALRWPPLCKKMFLTITFELKHLGRRFWCLDLCFWGQGSWRCHLFCPMTLTFQGHDLCKITFLDISQFLSGETLPNFNTR